MLSTHRLPLLLLAIAAALPAQPAKHALKLDDLPRFREVRAPQLAPEWAVGGLHGLRD